MCRPCACLEPIESRVLLTALPIGHTDDAPIVTIDWEGRRVEVFAGRWMVQFDGYRGNLLDQQSRASRAIQRMGSSFRMGHHLGADGLFLVYAPLQMPVGDVISGLWAVAGVRGIEPDFSGELLLTPNDPLFDQMWGLHNTGQAGGVVDADVDGPEAWDVNRGNGSVVVGIVDSGIDYNHPDLNDNIWINTLEIPDNNIDDDGNGYIDDVRGWDFGENDNDPMGDGDHGTHVAGTVGAEGNNAVGVTGVAWDVQLMALKMTPTVGSVAATAAMNYALAMRTRALDPVNMRVTNHSWGVFGFSQILSDAIAQHAANGIIMTCAAGNGTNNNDVDPLYPASYEHPNVISVGNLTRFNERAANSNFGAMSVDLFAPGTDILSTVRTVSGSYSLGTGTSTSAPHVAGAAALLWSAAPAATYQQVRDAIFQGVDAVASLAGLCVTGGRLNAHGALDRLLNLPPRVTDAQFRFDDHPSALTVSFSENVSASLNVNDLVLVNLTTSTTVPPANLAMSYGAGDVARFTFPGFANGVLPNGDYRATIQATDVLDPSGNPMAADFTFDFFFLNADANRDRRVNLIDFNILAANFGQSDRTFSQGDFNYDTVVNLLDFNILASSFGVTAGAVDQGTSSAFGDSWFGDTSAQRRSRQVLDLLS